MAKIGISINMWKGEEFLPHLIAQIKKHVGYVVVVYQDKSNFGEIREDFKPILKRMVEYDFISEYVVYSPKTDVEEKYLGIANELEKRNIGLKKCIENGCTHLFDCDTDEFYHTEQFEKAVKEVIEGGYDSSFAKMRTYYKYPDCVLKEVENYYVPFIYKIDENSKFEPIENIDFPVLTDGKRRIKSSHPLVFNEDELMMHHYSYVRKSKYDMLSKFNNASSRLNLSKERIDELIECWENFDYGDIAKIGKDQNFETERITNLFNLKI